MKRKIGKRRLRKDDDTKQRLVDIEIDEISLVDKPAIGETFTITKSLSGKGITLKKLKKSVLIKKGSSWGKTVTKSLKKSDHDHGDHCKFCQITKEEEAEQMGMGLLCSVCFECAIEHAEKGVFDECIAGTFDFDKFITDNPDIAKDVEATIEAKKSEDSEDDDEDDEDDDDESGDDSEDGEDGDDDEDDADDSSDDDSDDDSSSDDSDDSEDGEDSEDDDDEETEKSKKKSKSKKKKSSKKKSKKTSKVKTTEERVKASEDKLKDIQVMLSSSLEMHSQAANFLNEVVAINMSLIDMVMALQEGDMSDETKSTTKSLKKSLKSFRADVQKAGAKISAGRLNTLQDIATKLSELIQSVSGDAAKAAKKGGKNTVKSEDLESLKKDFKDLKKTFTDSSDIDEVKSQLEKMQNRMDDMESSAHSSAGIDDDDDIDDDSDEDESTSVFKDFGPLADVSKRIKSSTRKSRK